MFHMPVNHSVLVRLIWPEMARDIMMGNSVPKSPKLPEIYSTREECEWPYHTLALLIA